MPELSIDLNNRYKAGFGFVAQNTVPRVANVGLAGKLAYWDVKTFEERSPQSNQTNSLQIIDPIKAAGVSQMGTPVFDIVTLSHPELGNSYTFELLPMIDISRAKKIVETEIVGGPGEVVELISTKQWDVRLRGLLVDMDGHQFPMDQLKELSDLFEFDNTLKIESEVLNVLEIHEVYFRDFNPQFLEGFRDTIAFTLTGKSHVPVEVLIIEGQ